MKPKPLQDVDDGVTVNECFVQEKKKHIEQFQRLVSKDDIQSAIEVLRSRLPDSAHVYNMALMSSIFPGIEFYVYKRELLENSILMLIIRRPDFGQDINISTPVDIKITDSLKHAFAETSAIDWTEKYIFSACLRPISLMLLEISTMYKGNGTICNPNYYYYMSQEDAAALEFTSPPGVKVHSLDSEAGANFLVKGWKFSLPGTLEYTKNVIASGLSSGVYVDGNPVAGVIANPAGLLGMLYTGRDHRNAGYGKLCTMNLMKQLGTKGFVVGSAVECNNEASNKFHQKLGMKVLYKCDYILYSKSGFESK